MNEMYHFKQANAVNKMKKKQISSVWVSVMAISQVYLCDLTNS